jgi:lipid-A-disaccharide synthase
VRYVGHPLADAIPLLVDRGAARAAIGLGDIGEGPVVALLPGSRRAEVGLLAEPMLETAAYCYRERPELRFVAPMVSASLYDAMAAAHQRIVPDLPLTLLHGQSRDAIAAADCVLTASGTATLEALLLKRPMLVAYRLNPVTYHLVKALRLIKVPYAAMANLLTGRELAPEFLQARCTPALMGPALLALLDDGPRRAEIAAEYDRIHRTLRHDAARSAAAAVLELIGMARSVEVAR